MPIQFPHPTTGEQVTVNIQPESVVISPRYGESYSFDRAGRLLSLFVDGQSLQRTLDNRLLVRQKDAKKRRRELDSTESDRLLQRVFGFLAELADLLGQVNLSPEQHDPLQAVLTTILAMDPTALAADGEAYRQLFLPVSILPPDQYRALVVQATIGCSWNKCTFCGLYRDRQFRVRGVDEFQAYCVAVLDFFGAGLSLRRGIFLADANALTIPQARLLDLIDVVRDVFPAQPIFSFVSAFDVQRKSPQDWATLREHGLQQVYIGLETGDDNLLRFIKKPGNAQDAIQAVQDIKAGGIAAGIIVMVGLGGDKYATDHVTNTVATVRAMALTAGDVIYLSAYRPAPQTEYPQEAAIAGITALTPPQEQEQQRLLRDQLRALNPAVKVAPYHVDGFAL